jgi:L-cysteine:1D-myo-inositol 2-amino-2-deoxy-alpha-D-glucopyranoside ligase
VAEPLLAEIRSVLADDIDTIAAIAAVDRWVAGALEAPADTGDPDAPALMTRAVDALLGVAL